MDRKDKIELANQLDIMALEKLIDKHYLEFGKTAKKFMPRNIKGMSKAIVYDQMVMMCEPIADKIDKIKYQIRKLEQL